MAAFIFTPVCFFCLCYVKKNKEQISCPIVYMYSLQLLTVSLQHAIHTIGF